MSNAAKNFDILVWAFYTIILIIQQDHFSDLYPVKILDLSVQSSFPYITSENHATNSPFLARVLLVQLQSSNWNAVFSVDSKSCIGEITECGHDNFWKFL